MKEMEIGKGCKKDEEEEEEDNRAKKERKEEKKRQGRDICVRVGEWWRGERWKKRNVKEKIKRNRWSVYEKGLKIYCYTAVNGRRTKELTKD